VGAWTAMPQVGCSHVGLLGHGRQRIARAVHLMLRQRGQSPKHPPAHRNRTDAPPIRSADDRGWICSEATTHNEGSGQATQQGRCAMRQLHARPLAEHTCTMKTACVVWCAVKKHEMHFCVDR
jgi:hypothetical protein